MATIVYLVGMAMETFLVNQPSNWNQNSFQYFIGRQVRNLVYKIENTF